MNESRLSCGIILVRQSDAGWVTLMLRAYRHWDFPKGIRERGEEPLDAAKREVAEETGITEFEFNWGDRYFEPGPLPFVRGAQPWQDRPLLHRRDQPYGRRAGAVTGNRRT